VKGRIELARIVPPGQVFHQACDGLLDLPAEEMGDLCRHGHGEGALTCEVQHGPTIPTQPVAYGILYVWGRGPQAREN
jgi:hypothetical protein